MAPRSQLHAFDLVEAIASAAAVVGDHALALDQLSASAPVSWTGVDGAPSDEAGSDEPSFDEPVADDPAVEPERSDGAGSSLSRTLAAAAEAMASASSDMASVSSAMVRGARTARGASAVAEVLAGLDEALRNADHLDAERFAIGLEVAAERLAGGDDGAHAGCLPAVVAAAAAGALSALDVGADLGDTVIAAADEGLAELESGPTNNPELAELGTVDATAAGFLLLLDVVASVVTGEPLPEPPSVDPSPTSDGRRYEVRCRIRPHDGCGIESADWLESTWYQLGELTEFDGLGPVWRVGLLTTAPGAAVEAVFEVGRPHDLHIGLAPSAS